MTISLEQELEQLIDSADYCVMIWASDRYMKLTLIYRPNLRIRGEGALAYIANGKIAESWFRGRRQWPKAKKWALRQIAGHKELVRTVRQA